MKIKDIFKNVLKNLRTGKTAREIYTEQVREIPINIWEQLELEADYHPLIREYYRIVTPKYDRITRYAEYDIMELTIPEINSALDIYKSEICAGSVDGKYFDIYVSNETHRRLLEETLQNWITDLEYSTMIKFPDLIKRLLKYGDMFLVPRIIFENNNPIAVENYELVPEEHMWKAIVEENKKIYWIRLPMINKKMLTITSTQKIPDILLRVNILRFRTMYELENFLRVYNGNIEPYVVHIKINPDSFIPFGTSILESVRLMWKQLKILDDALIIMRIFRGVERLIWKINVGKIPPREAEEYIQQIKQRIRKTRAFKEGVGLEEGPHILGLIEDLFLPVIEGKEINLETISPATNLGEIEDILHFRKRFYIGLKIPRSYLRFEETGESGKHLALQDAKFSALIKLYQDYIAMGITDALRLHLQFKARKDKIFSYVAQELRVKMKPPPTTHEETFLEILDSRIDIAQKYLNFGFKKEWVLKNILHSSMDDLAEEPEKKETV